MKKVLFGLGAIVVILILINALLPNKVKVERSMVMDASASSVFNNINNLKKWSAWSPWAKLDSSINESGFEGPEFGVGSKHCWDSEHKDVGRGCQTITESVPNEKLLTEMDFYEQGTGHGFFYLKETDAGTEVTWGFESKIPFTMRIMGLMMNEIMGPVFEQGLTDLEAVSQTKMSGLGTSYNIETIDVEAMGFLTVSGSHHPDGIGEFLGKSYGIIGAAMGNTVLVGSPSALYHSYTDTMVHLDAALAVEEELDGFLGVDYKSFEAHKALKIDFYGWYGDVGPAHMAIDDYMETNGLEMAGPVREVYITDPSSEADTSKWLTEIYYPIR